VRDGVTLVAVTLNDPDDWADHTAMLDYGFSVVKNREVQGDLPSLSLHIVGSDKKEVPVSLLYTPYLPTVGGGVCADVRISLKQFEYAPVSAGDSVGTAYYYLNGRKVAEVPLVASESAENTAEQPKESVFNRIKNFLKRNFGAENG